MSDRFDQAAKLLAMAAINQARRTSRVVVQLTNVALSIYPPIPSTKRTAMLNEVEEAKPLHADVMREVAVDGVGVLLTDEQITEDSTPQWVRLGSVTFTIVDAAADAMARELGAIGQDDDHASEPPRLCLRALIKVPDGQPQPRMGDVLVLRVDGVPLLFTHWISYSDAHAPISPDSLGDSEPDDWERNPALDSLQPGEALLVQKHQIAAADGTVALHAVAGRLVPAPDDIGHAGSAVLNDTQQTRTR